MVRNPSWRHHYIPEFYLKQWAVNEGKGCLVEYSKPWGDTVKPKRVTPRQTGFEDRLNELAGLPDPERECLETHFYKPVDSAAASVLHALKNGRREISERERVAWARFLTSLYVRNPENILAATVRVTENAYKFNPEMERRYRARRAPDDPETFSEYMRNVDLADEFSRAAKESMVTVIENGLVTNHIFGMLWGALELPFDAPPLLTSDRPLHIPNGLPNPESQVLLPLGPKFLFFAVNRIELVYNIRALSPLEIATTMNEIVVRRAQKYVYALSDRHLDYVQANMGIAQETPIAAVRHSRAERRRRDQLFQKLTGSKHPKFYSLKFTENFQWLSSIMFVQRNLSMVEYGLLPQEPFQRFMRRADEEGHDRRAGEKYVREN
jgi:hypothetical protein